jgi:cytochrome c-type biogenesis protein CcmE
MTQRDPEEVVGGVETPARTNVKPREKKQSVAKWIVLGVIVVAIALIGSTVRGTAFVYSKYVDEITAPGELRKWVGRTVRVEGLVVPSSISNRPGTREYRFRITRNHAELPVEYSGIVPDTFRDCAGVTVKGVLNEQGMFVSDEVIGKCPSRYEAATVVNGQCVIGLSPERPNGAAPMSPPLGTPPVR